METTLYQKLKGWHYRPGKDLTLIMRVDGEDAQVSTGILGRRTAPFPHLPLFLTAPRMGLPQDPSTESTRIVLWAEC